MADLLKERIIPDLSPFMNAGVDYFGPVGIKRGRTACKHYGVIIRHLHKCNTPFYQQERSSCPYQVRQWNQFCRSRKRTERLLLHWIMSRFKELGIPSWQSLATYDMHRKAHSQLSLAPANVGWWWTPHCYVWAFCKLWHVCETSVETSSIYFGSVLEMMGQGIPDIIARETEVEPKETEFDGWRCCPDLLQKGWTVFLTKEVWCVLSSWRPKTTLLRDLLPNFVWYKKCKLNHVNLHFCVW